MQLLIVALGFLVVFGLLTFVLWLCLKVMLKRAGAGTSGGKILVALLQAYKFYFLKACPLLFNKWWKGYWKEKKSETIIYLEKLGAAQDMQMEVREFEPVSYIPLYPFPPECESPQTCCRRDFLDLTDYKRISVAEAAAAFL